MDIAIIGAGNRGGSAAPSDNGQPLGGLRMARTTEGLAGRNTSLNATHGWAWQRAFRLVGRQQAA